MLVHLYDELNAQMLGYIGTIASSSWHCGDIWKRYGAVLPLATPQPHSLPMWSSLVRCH